MTSGITKMNEVLSLAKTDIDCFDMEIIWETAKVVAHAVEGFEKAYVECRMGDL